MKSKQKGVLQTALHPDQALTLGDYAYQIICEQYQAVIKQEKKVLADKHPEHLHQMRVATRRLRTALQVFDRAVELPKVAQAKHVGSIARVLGGLRDLDVQIANIQSKYRSQLSETGQRSIDEVLDALRRQRRKAFTATEDVLQRSRYRDLKTAYETWLDEPRFTTLAQLPLLPLLPDLLSPLLSELLLHPGWLVEATDTSEAANTLLHELRKACKYVRYQAEFFGSFYGEAFKSWIDDIKTLQANLGEVHDSQVLQDLLTTHLPKHGKDRSALTALQEAIERTQTDVMSDWESVRQKYLDATFRHHLHQMLLEPTVSDAPDK